LSGSELNELANLLEKISSAEGRAFEKSITAFLKILLPDLTEAELSSDNKARAMLFLKTYQEFLASFNELGSNKRNETAHEAQDCRRISVNRDSPVAVVKALAAVNAYRATLGLAPFSSSQIDGSLFSRLDLRISKAFALGESRKIEVIGQVFNVLGRDNLGGPSTFYQTNARSDAFGRIQAALPRQQGELAVRFVF
jgi:hypothetical protein